jgi:hypothetical protein
MKMNNLPNFKLRSLEGGVSEEFVNFGIDDFHSAVNYVGELPYGRTSDRSDYRLVLLEGTGTCSTKHALLAQLCIEQEINEISLVLGMYRMNETNTPGVGAVLNSHNLKYIPEAHCYLSYENNRFDFTRLHVESMSIQEFLVEKVIKPEGIGEYKVNFHKNYINQWKKEKKLSFDFEQLWKIREDCIKALSK